MRMSRHFPKTLRSVSEDLTQAHALMLRAGLIRQVSPGIYTLLPLGWRVHQKVKRIIFEEMEKREVHNLEFPILQPKEIWQKTGRWEKYLKTKTMFTTKELFSQQDFGLAPTAEEVATTLAMAEIQSWRDLPQHFHQIGPKFRDEIRPRLGLLRAREFSMSDAYSFDADEEGMRRSFQMYREIYQSIFQRVGLNRFISVQADSGAIGGSGSAEFMALSEEVGEDFLLTCEACDYGANVEKADSVYRKPRYGPARERSRKVHTPGIRTVEELKNFFKGEKIQPHHMVKTVLLSVIPSENREAYEVAVCIRGDLDVNLTKVRNLLKADEVFPAEGEVVERLTGAEVGFAGPLGLEGRVERILFDLSTKGMTNFLCGCNETDYHQLDVNFGVDLPLPKEWYNLHIAQRGHRCPECRKGKLIERRGIEVGHVFMLQTSYSAPLSATYTDANGQEQLLWMGCYGIGTTRLMQAIVDQNRDEDGIVWPWSVAPYQVMVVVANSSDAQQAQLGEEIYRHLRGLGLEVMLDDRDYCSAGEKFKDADLLGFPFRVTVGRYAKEGLAELKERKTGRRGRSEKLSVEGIGERLLEHWKGGDPAAAR
ncbi:MAG: proline--tRNA ligase [Planctomycetota bacterium]|nr:MAG: proline--tRNA ligase [Planctomycetota bacterium]